MDEVLTEENKGSPVAIAYWSNITTAVEKVSSGEANRVEGDGWKVYRVVNIVRIDIRDC